MCSATGFGSSHLKDYVDRLEPTLQDQDRNHESFAGIPVKLLLWSPGGAGHGYHGPGAAAARVYRLLAREKGFNCDLAHAVAAHSQNAIFREMHYVGDLGSTPLGRTAFLLRANRWIARHSADYDVVHGLSAYLHTMIPCLAFEKKNVPTVIKITNANTNLSVKPGLNRLLGLSKFRQRKISQISGFIAISQDICEELMTFGVPAEKIHFIPNGVDCIHFTPADQSQKETLRRELGIPNRPTVVFVGALARRKCPHLVVEAVCRMEDTQLLLVGPEDDSEYCLELKRIVAQAGADDRIFFAGFHRDTRRFVMCSDIFCLPSKNEGLSNAMLESAACGVTPICTAVSGARDLIRHGETGFFVEPSQESIYAMLVSLMESPTQLASVGRNARKKIVSDYSLENVAALHQRLFSSLVY